MKDFLTFHTFITPSLLLLIYYVGALFIPLFSWYLARWLRTVYKTDIENYTAFKQRSILFIAFFIFFFCMEITLASDV